MKIFELANLPRSKELLHTYCCATLREIILEDDDEFELYIPENEHTHYLAVELYFPFRNAIFEEIKAGNITSPSLYLGQVGNKLYLIKVR